MEPLAETWECSTHPDGLSVAASGVHAGLTLKEVLKLHPEYLGTHPSYRDGLPILIKFIDAREDLSVQVHPDDAYAAEHENGSLGKTEMWYIVDKEASDCRSDENRWDKEASDCRSDIMTFATFISLRITA